MIRRLMVSSFAGGTWRARRPIPPRQSAALRRAVVSPPDGEARRQEATDLDPAKLEAFGGKVLGDLAVALSARLVLAGEKLGLYKALAERPATAAELAKRTKTAPRYVAEWLGNQAASGYVEYDATTKT